MGPSHALQFFKIYSSMGPFYRVQSLKKRLLQQRLQLLPGGFSCIGCPWACRANPQENGIICFTIISFMDCKEISALAPGSPLPLPYSLDLVSSGLFVSNFSRSFFSKLLCSVLYPFFSFLLLSRHQQCCWLAQLWPAMCLLQSQLALAVSHGTAPGHFQQRPPLHCSTANTLP